MEEPSPDPVIRDVPWSLWMPGLCLGGFGALMVQSTLGRGEQLALFSGAVLSGVGLLMVALSSTLTIRADRESGFLTLTYRSLLTKKVKEIPLCQIASVDIESTGSNKSACRVVITEHDGQVTPLRSYYSSGNKVRLANRLRELTGVGGFDGGPLTPKQTLRMLTGQDERVNQQIRHQQEGLTGSNAETHETAGVHWNIQSAGMGREPVTRWFSPDFQTNGTFVYIAQIPAHKKTVGGMIGKLFTRGLTGKLAARASMALFGFVGDDVPRSNLADLFALDPPLDLHFVAFSQNPSAARQILNPWVTQALVDWAVHHPLKTIQVRNVSGQLVVLFSPNGVYAATLGLLDPARLAELAATGAELVNAQRPGAQ